MNKWEQALKDIQSVREQTKGMNFENAAKLLGGYNCDGTLFDYDYGCVTGTIINENGLAVMDDETCFDIYDETYIDTGMVDHMTEQEIKELAMKGA